MTIRYKGIRNAPLQEDNTETVTTSKEYIFPFDGGESPVALRAHALYATNVPAMHSQHSEDPTLYAQNISIDMDGGDEVVSAAYVVTVAYSSNIKRDNALSGGAKTAEDKTGTVAPWKLPPYDVSILPNETIVPFIFAYQSNDTIGNPSKPVLNPAGDPYETVTVEQNTLIQFSYNVRDFGTRWIETYKDTINNSDITIIGKSIKRGRARLKNLSATEQKWKDPDGDLIYKFWKVNIEIEERKTEWNQQILARGLFFRIGGDATKRVRIYTDNDGHFGAQDDSGFTAGKEVVPVDEPQKLKLDGDLLAADAAPADTVYQTFNDKFATNWKPLFLPKSTR